LESDNAEEGSEEYFDESEHVDGLAEEERSTGVARAGLDGRGPYRNKWSRSQGTGWGARRVMARSMKPQCWNVTLHVSEPVVSLVP